MKYFFSALFLVIFPACLFAKAPDTLLADRKLKNPVKQELGLRDVSIQRIELPDRSEESFNFKVKLDQELVQIVFNRHSNRSASYRLLIQQEDGSLSEQPAGPVETYRGAGVGFSESFSTGSFVGDAFKGFIQIEDDRWWFESIKDRVRGASENIFAVYRASDVISPEGFCGTIHQVMDKDEVDALEERDAGGNRSIRYAEIVCDSDYEYFQAQGSEANVESQINAIMNSVNALYEQQLELSHYITEVVVRPTSSDPYSGSINSQLSQLTSQWSSHPSDVVHLFSASSYNNGGTIGLAWLGGVCSTQGAAVVLDCCNSFSCLTDLSAHELGHNWNAPHIDDGNTMNSSLACANNFSSGSINTITSFSNAISSCLDENLACTDEGGVLAYDHCSGALPVSSGSTSFDTSNAQQSCDGYTDVLVCPNTNLGDMFNDVWFSWEPSLPGEATVTSCSDSVDCPVGFTADCQGTCFPDAVYSSWLGDGYCDDGSYVPSDYGFEGSPAGVAFYANCNEFSCDNGDCTGCSGSGGGGFDSDLVIYRSEIGSCQSKTEIACNGDALVCSSGGSSVSFDVAPGNVYFIRVGGALPSESGPGQLLIEQEVVLEGACCAAGNCYQFTANECAAVSGQFNGAGSPCFSDTCAAPCPADFNGDQLVNVLDLLELVAAFGTPNGDINGDNDTNTLDLLEVVSAFGSCD